VLRRASILRPARRRPEGSTGGRQCWCGTKNSAGRLPGVMKKRDWGRRCTKGRGPASSRRWTRVRVSGSIAMVVWSCSTGCGAVERAPDCRGSGEAKADAALWAGRRFASFSRTTKLKTVAEKKLVRRGT